MTIPEAAQLVIQAGAMGKGGDVFVLDMGESVKIIDLARQMIVLSGLKAKTSNTRTATSKSRLPAYARARNFMKNCSSATRCKKPLIPVL